MYNKNRKMYNMGQIVRGFQIKINKQIIQIHL